jgi:hypothetical protein
VTLDAGTKVGPSDHKGQPLVDSAAPLCLVTAPGSLSTRSCSLQPQDIARETTFAQSAGVHPILHGGRALSRRD